MPGKSTCNKIKDPVKRKHCLSYSGSYAKKKTSSKPVRGSSY